MSRAFDVGAVAHQREHAARAVVRKSNDIDRLSVDGRKVHLKVARMNHGTNRCVDRESDRARDGMPRFDELDLKAAELDKIAGFDHVEFLARNPRFF